MQRLFTVCPRSSDPFYIVSYYIKWVTTSWTHSIKKGIILESTPCMYKACMSISTKTLWMYDSAYETYECCAEVDGIKPLGYVSTQH